MPKETDSWHLPKLRDSAVTFGAVLSSGTGATAAAVPADCCEPLVVTILAMLLHSCCVMETPVERCHQPILGPKIC